MDKNWNYAKKMLFGALICGLASPAFVGCKDYDDDIDELQKQITENKEAIEANKKALEDIQAAVKAGAILSSVEKTANGIVVKLSNGNSYTITNGVDGKDGVNGTNGKDGQDGQNGKDATLPTFTVENGLICADGEPISEVKIPTIADFSFAIDENGELTFNGQSLGTVVGKDGQPGENGNSPKITFDFEETALVIKVDGEEVARKELKGATGADANLENLKFQIKEGVLEYSKDGGESWVATSKVTGENGSSVTLNDFKFSVDKGVLYLGEGAEKKVIGNILTPADFTVTPDGYLNVYNQPTGVRINGSYIIESETQFTIRMPQGNDKGELVLGDDQTVTYMDVTIPKNLDKIHVTSVKFVPMTSEGSNLKVNYLKGTKMIQGLFGETPATRYIYATGSQLRFRVNPVEAKLGTDFTVLETMDQFKLSRSGVEFSLKKATLGEGGLVYANFGYEGIEYSEKKLPENGETYTLAAGIKNIHTGEVIYSDYFTFNTNPDEVTAEFVNDKDKLAEETMTFELVRGMGNSVNIAEKIFMKAQDNGKYYTLDHFGFDKPEFTITKKVANQTSPFTVEGSTIKVNDVSFQAQGKTVDYIVTARIGDFIINTQEISVTMIEEVGNLNLIENVTVKDFNGSAKEIALKLATGAINNFNTYFQTDVTKLDESVTFAITDEKGKDATASFTTFNQLSNEPKITVNKGTKSGIYNVVMTVTRKTETTEMKSETKFTITVEGIEFQENWKTPGYWEDQKDAIIIKVDKATGDFKSDLTKLFTLPDELDVDVQFTIKKDEKKVIIVGNEAQITNEEKKKFAMNTSLSGNIVAQLVNAADKSMILDEKEISVTFENPFKSFRVAGTEKLTMVDATVSGEQNGVTLDINDLLTLTLTVDDRAGNTDKNIISPKNEKADPKVTVNNTILEDNKLYGAEKIIYKLPKDHDSRFSITEKGVLTWKNTGTALVTPVKTSVTIVIDNNWKPIEQTVTVTVQPN